MRCRYHCASPNLYASHKVIYVFSAYELYADPKSGERRANDVGGTDDQEHTTMAARFKNAFSNENVKVHFVGAWCVIQIMTRVKQNGSS